MQHVTSFTMFDSYHVGLFTTQTRDFEKIQYGPQCVKRCMIVHKDPRCNLCAETSSYVSSVYAHQPFLGMNGAPWPNC